MKTLRFFLTLLIFISGITITSFADRSATISKPQIKAARDAFYSEMQTKFNFSKADCAAVRQSGHSALFAFILLNIAKEAGVSVSVLIKMRDEDGAGWKDMCDAYKIDYNTFMDKVEKMITDNDLFLPIATAKETRRDITTAPRKKGGK
jgi:hypothetical protein